MARPLSTTLLWTLAMCLLYPCACRHRPVARSQTYAVDRTFERGPLAARLRMDPDKINIADSVLLELEAQYPGQYRVRMPKIDPVLQDFLLVDWDALPDRLAEDGRLVKTHRYRLEPIVSGSYQIPALSFEFTDVNDPNQVHTLQTEPVEVQVASLLPPDRNDLTIHDIEPVVQVKSSGKGAWLAGIGVGLAALAALGAWWWARRRKATAGMPVMRPAHELAYDRLAELVQAGHIEAGRIKQFYVGLSHVVRHYIEDRFYIHAPEQTTEEFLHYLANTDLLNPSDKHDLAEFLHHCDQVKFARYQPTTEQIQRTFDLAKAFIEKTKSERHLLEDPVGTGAGQGPC